MKLNLIYLIIIILIIQIFLVQVLKKNINEFFQQKVTMQMQIQIQNIVQINMKL